MPAWLYETASATAGSIVGFGVLDALGMRLGSVGGWIWAPDRTLAYLELTSRSVLRDNHRLVPLGYVVQVDAGHRYVHLRELTRRTLDAHCPRIDERRLPDDDTLAAGIEAAPAPRPDIVVRLRRPDAGVDALVPERIAVQRDGSSASMGALFQAPARTAAPIPAWDRMTDTPDTPRTWERLTSAPKPAEWHPLLSDSPSGDTAPR